MRDNLDLLNADEKMRIRTELVFSAGKLLGIPYELGAECKNFTDMPLALDCSELVEWVYGHIRLKMVDGSQAQFESTVDTKIPQVGDLAFFGRGGSVSKIYHVGLVFDSENIIEARGFQADSSFETGKVILRPRRSWEDYKNFVGYRSHAKLI